MTALPPGVLATHVLPSDHHRGQSWDAIITPAGVKERLLATALLRLEHGRALASLAGPLHGVIILSGPPGTGKTSLCRGLGEVAAAAVARSGATTLVEIDPHAFPSELLGESQRNITALFRDTLPELAARRPHTIVLIDEVESFAVRRAAASFEANPVDVHRATDAVLAGIDALSAEAPAALFLVTTNFVSLVDEAFLSRADLVIELALPDRETAEEILRSALAELAARFSGLARLATDDALVAELAGACVGLDGRRIRKLPLQALATRPELARDPSSLAADDLRVAAGCS